MWQQYGEVLVRHNKKRGGDVGREGCQVGRWLGPGWDVFDKNNIMLGLEETGQSDCHCVKSP